MYGSATELVITGTSDGTFGTGVHRFVLDPSLGEFIYIGPIAVPAKCKTIYSCNEGNSKAWDPEIQKAVATFKGEDGGKVYSARYIGSMVSDVHRTLLYGGIFMYPADKNSPKGKLRARSHCRFVLSPIHFIPDLLTYSVPLFLKRQCDRTLGKLRMLYEGFPMALITEQAGGVASTGMFEGSISRGRDCH
jgi:fructose-1,6-bisphosphatase I